MEQSVAMVAMAIYNAAVVATAAVAANDDEVGDDDADDGYNDVVDIIVDFCWVENTYRRNFTYILLSMCFGVYVCVYKPAVEGTVAPHWSVKSENNVFVITTDQQKS